MIDKITKEIEKINKTTNTKTREFNKAFKPAEKAKLHHELARLDGKIEAYMHVLNMLEEE